MKSSTVFTGLTATALACLAGYAVYFDYKRRNDPQFRRTLKKAAVKQGKVEKAQAEKSEKETNEAIKAAVLEANIEVEAFKRSVTGAEQGEAYFMQCVGNGEVLAAMGPDSAIQAASAFFKALKVYPSPVELLMIYERTVPEHIFKLVMQMTSHEVANATATKKPEGKPSVEEEKTKEEVKEASKEENVEKPAPQQVEEVKAEATAPSGTPVSAPSDSSSHEWENITGSESKPQENA